MPKRNGYERLPPISYECKCDTDNFLNHILERVEIQVSQYRELVKVDRSQHALNQFAYFKSQSATIRWLLSMNAQRRVKNEMSTTR